MPETRTLYQWSRADGTISSHVACWYPRFGTWVEEWSGPGYEGWQMVEDGFWQESPDAARAAARRHFERERERADEVLARLAAPS